MSMDPRRIIGFSANPTRYKMVLSNGQVHVRCGADLLINGLKTDLMGEGKCPVCDGLVKFQINQGHMLELQPSESVLHVVEVITLEGRVKKVQIKCEATHLFDRDHCLRQWLSTYEGPKGSILPPQDYFEKLKDQPRQTPTGPVN